MATQLSDMQQIALALNKIGEELKGLSEKMDSMTLEIKKTKQEMKENFAKQALDISSIKEEIVEIHAHDMKTNHQIGQIIVKNEQQDKRIYLLEEESRKYNLVIRGIQEEKADHLKQRVLKWLNNLGVITFSATDLASVFRIGYKRRNDLNRNVLVRFADLSDKIEVMAKLRDLGVAPEFEGKTIQVFPDISREERAWRYFLKPITKVLRDNEINYNWRPPQQLKFFYKNRMQTITPQTDAVEYLRELGLIGKEEDIIEIKNQLLKMGGIYTKTSTPEGKGVAGEDSKGTKRKEISPVMVEQKKSRDEKGDRDGKVDDFEKMQEAECGQSSLSFSALLSDKFK